MNPETTEQTEASHLQNESESVEKEKPPHLRSLLDFLPSSPSSYFSSPQVSPLLPPLTPPFTIEKRLHIANIPYQWVDEDLIRLFRPYGETKHEEVVVNDRGSKGFGFVTFLDAAAADRARSDLNGVVFDGRSIRVNEATRMRIERNRPGIKDQRREQCSSVELGVLLMQQKQLLAQQQLQQLLAAKQQSDMISMVLGLPTSNVGGVLTGGESLPFPPLAGMPPGVLPGVTIDSLAIQQQLLQSLSLLQPLQPQLQSLPLLQQPPAFQSITQNGQVSTVPAGYTMPQSFPVDGVRTEVDGQMMNVTPYDLLPSNEMAGSSSVFRSTPHKNDVPSQRYNPY